jgi:hypothetical protein
MLNVRPLQVTEVRKADPAARRQVALVLAVGTCVGALLIVAFDRYRIPLSDWLLADPGARAQRLKLVFLVLDALVVAPLLAFAAYVWSLGGRTIRAREFPPPGLPVIRDTLVIAGEKAISRGRLLKLLALGCAVASAVLGFLLWHIESLLSDNAA